jgi:4-amino-4-deoxy-L-arabinose transferase-like glycosyltransferase
VLVLVCVVHFALGALVGLSVDEAHYALYAAHPALSYFDHPPLVGWVQWPLVALNTPTAVLRLVPELLWLGTALLVFGLAERLQGAPSRGQAGLWAVLAWALAPLPHVLGIGLLPDTLLMFWTAALMAATLHLMDASAVQRPGPWLALGVLLGLAGLSKYTAILAALAVALCLLVAHGARLLGNRWLWVAVLVALVLVAPVAVWNYQNHWISFTYQAQHGAGGGWQAGHVLRFLLIQVLAYGPLLLWGWAGVRHDRTGPPRSLRLFFAVPFVLLAYLAGGGTSLPHWTAPAWVALAPFAGVALARAWHDGRRTPIVALVVLQGLASAALLGLMLTAGAPFISGAQGQGNTQAPSNPFADLHGWDAAGQRARTLAAQHGLASVSVQNWTLASRLGWYARPLPVHVLESRFDQFTLWAGDLPVGGDTLLVDWSQLAYAVPQGAHGFADCTLLEQQPVQRLGATIATFRFYACHRWSGDPQPRLADSP